jgi:hypothetical protein
MGGWQSGAARRNDVLLRNSSGDESWTFERDFTASLAETTRLLDAVEQGVEPPHSVRDNLMTMACWKPATNPPLKSDASKFCL